MKKELIRRLFKTTCVSYFLLICTAVLNPFSVEAGVLLGIKNIHATYSGDPRHEVTVSWRTEVPLRDARVLYGLPGQPRSEWGIFHAETIASMGGYNHHARMPGLEPNTRYAYRVSGPDGSWGPACHFRTAPGEGASFTFAVIGDVQGKEEPSGIWQAAGDWLADQDDVLFALLLGDLVDTGYSQTQWDAFFNSLHPGLSRRLFHSTIIMPLIGNHDTYGGEDNRQGLQVYLDQFRLPPNGQGPWAGHYYAFDIADARFVILDTEGAVPDRVDYMAAQTRWMSGLDWDARPWTFAAHHRSTHPIRRHAPSQVSRHVWRPHFFDRRVDMVFNGHNHSFAVTYPMKPALLHGLSGGRHFTGPWRAEVDTGCPSGLPNLLLLEENEPIRYPGYQAAGRSVHTYPAGSLQTRAIQAERRIEPIDVSSRATLWMGYLYQKRGGWYAEHQGGWRLSNSANSGGPYLQVATSRVEQNGHFRIHVGSAYADSALPIAPEGRPHVPSDPFFVLARFIFEEGQITGQLKSYRAPAALPTTVPTEWDAEVVWNGAWEGALDTVTLLGEDRNRESLIDEFRLGWEMRDVLPVPAGSLAHRGQPLVEERFDAVPSRHDGKRVVYYDGGAINSSGAANDSWFIRAREDRLNMPLLGLFTVTPERVIARTVFFADFENWRAGDVFDAFELSRD